MNKKSVSEIYDAIAPIFENNFGTIDRSYAETIIGLMREKVQFANEIPAAAAYFFVEPTKYDEDVVAKKWKPETNQLLLDLGVYFQENAASNPAEYEQQFKNYCESKGIKTGEILQPLRVAVSGQPVGPPIFDMLALLTLPIVMNRLTNCTNTVKL
jgi:glutamyl-tRNA synthetase